VRSEWSDGSAKRDAQEALRVKEAKAEWSDGSARIQRRGDLRGRWGGVGIDTMVMTIAHIYSRSHNEHTPHERCCGCRRCAACVMWDGSLRPPARLPFRPVTAPRACQPRSHSHHTRRACMQVCESPPLSHSPDATRSRGRTVASASFTRLKRTETRELALIRTISQAQRMRGRD
jgi:hypothetical protein